MQQILNTLYVTTQGALLRLDHDSLRVKVDGQVKLHVPLLHLGGICCFGRVTPTVGLIHRCALDGRALVFFDPYGRFRARMTGPVSGNVLLRRAQHAALSDPSRCLAMCAGWSRRRSRTPANSSSAPAGRPGTTRTPCRWRQRHGRWRPSCPESRRPAIWTD